MDGPPPASHPAIRGRERELLGLADVVRRLVVLTVTNDASAPETADIVASLEALAERLAAQVPEPPIPRYVGAEVPDAPHGTRMPYDVVLGDYNPLALPISITFDPPRALGRAVFTTPYEGPPGCVHGAVIAGSFDMVLNAANQLAGVAGPTARLTIRYRRPTRLHRELTFESWVSETKGRRVVTIGRIVQNGEVTAEAEGLFVQLDHDRVMRLGEGLSP